MASMGRALAQASARRFLSRSLPIQSSYSTYNYYPRPATQPPPSPPPRRRAAAKEFPRPSTIPFQPKVSNSVELMGYIHLPVQFQETPDGKCWADTVITQDNDNGNDNITSDPTCFWIPIVFEGDLAHTALRHLKLDDYVHITGCLSPDPHPESAQASVQVIAQSISFIEGKPHKKKSLPTPNMNKDEDPDYVQKRKKDEEPASDPWRRLLDNPKQWWDYRSCKQEGNLKPRYPDFKTKDGELALWLDGAPGWVYSELGRVEFDVFVLRGKEQKRTRNEQSWKDLVENPDRWWDNRLDKKNPRYPDFKNKTTSEGLWLGDAPAWVRQQLPPCGN